MRKLILIAFTLVLLLSLHVSLKQPQNNRSWDPEFAVQTEIDEDFTFQHIRDWRYSQKEITLHDYTNKTYDPEKITNVWFLVEPFGAWDGVAHTYFTFDFSDNDPLSFSIEARREIGETYSGFRGLFREYELIYLWGTEDDLLVRRAVYLGNDVYMYPLQIPEDWKKNLFTTLVDETNNINNNPRFYNTLTSNCTNTLANIVNEIRPNTVPWHYSRLLTGYSDEYLAKLGYIPGNKENYKVDEFVEDNYHSPTFSEDLRNAILNNEL